MSMKPNKPYYIILKGDRYIYSRWFEVRSISMAKAFRSCGDARAYAKKFFPDEKYRLICIDIGQDKDNSEK